MESIKRYNRTSWRCASALYTMLSNSNERNLRRKVNRSRKSCNLVALFAGNNTNRLLFAGNIKNFVMSTKPTTREDMKVRIRETCAKINVQMLSKVRESF